VYPDVMCFGVLSLLGFLGFGERGDADCREDDLGVLRYFRDLGGRQTVEMLACTYHGTKTMAELY